jgi:hypothetical protein
MQRNSKIQEIEVSLQGVLHIKENGQYKLRSIQSRIGSQERIKSCEETYIVALCIDTLEEITGLNVGEMLRHAHEIENLL